MIEAKYLKHAPPNSKKIGEFKIEAKGDATILHHNLFEIHNGEQILLMKKGGFKGDITLDDFRRAATGEKVVLY